MMSPDFLDCFRMTDLICQVSAVTTSYDSGLRLRLLQGGNCLLPGNRRKVVEEFLKGVSSLKIIDQRLNRNPRANENRGAPQDIAIRVNDRCACHTVVLHPTSANHTPRLLPRHVEPTGAPSTVLELSSMLAARSPEAHGYVASFKSCLAAASLRSFPNPR